MVRNVNSFSIGPWRAARCATRKTNARAPLADLLWQGRLAPRGAQWAFMPAVAAATPVTAPSIVARLAPM